MTLKKQLIAIKEGGFWIQGRRALSNKEYQLLLEQAERAQLLEQENIELKKLIGGQVK